MSLLSGELPYADRLGNEIYTDFRNMIQLEGIFYNSEDSDRDRWLRALTLLYGDLREMPPDANYDVLAKELIWFYCEGEESKTEVTTKRPPKLYDFEIDASYIYAAFLQEYKVDLSLSVDELSLHWWQFLALFRSLPDNTRIMQRIDLRGTDTSELKGVHKRRVEQAKRSIAIRPHAVSQKHMTPEEREREMRDRVARRYEEAQKSLGNNQ